MCHIFTRSLTHFSLNMFVFSELYLSLRDYLFFLSCLTQFCNIFISFFLSLSTFLNSFCTSFCRFSSSYFATFSLKISSADITKYGFFFYLLFLIFSVFMGNEKLRSRTSCGEATFFIHLVLYICQVS